MRPFALSGVQRPVRRVSAAFVVGSAIAAMALALLVARGADPQILAAVLAVSIVAPLLGRWLNRHGRLTVPQAVAIGSLYAALASTLVFRSRTAAALATNPFDSAGIFRAAALAIALALATIAIVLSREAPAPPIPRVARRIALYALVVGVGIAVAVKPDLVAFRFVELVGFLAAFVACHRTFRGDVAVPMRHLMAFVFTLLVGALVGGVVAPDRAWLEQWEGQGTFRLHGVVPRNSSDFLGILSTIAVAFGLGFRRIRVVPVALGTVVVLLAQHRTGIIAVALLVVLRLLYQRRAEGKVLALAGVAVAAAVIASGVLSDAWARGNPEAVSTLSSRTEWWSAGLETVTRSPLVGLGLSSGARFEVFPSIDRDVTPNLHGTWVEVFVGTGIVGTLFLALAFGGATLVAHRCARRLGDLLPILMVAGLGVNSLTHTSFELASMTLLLLLLTGAYAEHRLTTTGQPGPADSAASPRQGRPTVLA